MSVTLTLTFASAAEAAAFLDAASRFDLSPHVDKPKTPTRVTPRAEVASTLKVDTENVKANAAPPVPAAKSAPAAPPVSAAKPAIEYPVLQKAVFELASKDKTKAMAVAAELGVKTFKELPPERYAEALDAVKAALAEAEAAAVA